MQGPEWNGEQALGLAYIHHPILSRSFWLVTSVKLQHRNLEQGDGWREAAELAWQRPCLEKGLRLDSLVFLGRETFQSLFVQHPLDS